MLQLRTLSAIREQARIARITLEATRRAANAARASADAARESVAATIESNRLTAESNETTKTSTELTRQSFLLTHRPSIIVRNIVMNGIAAGDVPEGNFRVINEGESEARITKIFATAVLYESLPMKPCYIDGPPAQDLAGKPLAPGESLLHPVRHDQGGLLPHQVNCINSETDHEVRLQKLYVLGYVTYEDTATPANVRTTYFCRRYHGDSISFEPYGNSDYERAD